MSASTRIPVVFLVLAAGLFICVPGAGAQQSICGTQDIAELLAAAGNGFDLVKQDAVLLFDGQEIRWLPGGRLKKDVHRIVWINTNIAINRYGDHRIPYDDAHCTFHVSTVRTWRDGRWWPSGPTGIVETLPYALRTAYDYTNMREMMLLHDGIELPCILEIAYAVEDKEPFRKGAEGLWAFARQEPAVRSCFTLGLPRGQGLNVFTPDGVPAPEKETDQESGLDIYRWKMGPLEAIPRPHTDDPAAYVPYVSWSTWADWNVFGKHLKDTFEAGIKMDQRLTGCLDSLLNDARTDGEKAGLIAGFINDRTRFVDYPEAYWWPTPRQAARTYSTAYGHRLDRAILAAALFTNGGLRAYPAFLGRGYGNIDDGVPTISRMNGIGVWVYGDNLDAWYDPTGGTVSHGPAPADRRTVWLPGVDEKPSVHRIGKSEENRFEACITLSLDKKKKSFTGTGFINAEGCLSPYGRMVGLGDEAKTCLGAVFSGMISGMKVTNFNPSVFTRQRVVIGCELELEKPEADDLDRLPLVIGRPTGGVFDFLPENVDLYSQVRSSPVVMPCPMNQKVELRLDTKGLEVIYSPSEQFLENTAGSFSLTAGGGDDRVIIIRKLKLGKAVYQPDEWPALRALLLAASHERNQTLLVKQAADEEKENGQEGADAAEE